MSLILPDRHFNAAKQFYERAFPRAIPAQKSNTVSAFNHQVYAVQNVLAPRTQFVRLVDVGANNHSTAIVLRTWRHSASPMALNTTEHTIGFQMS
jgi:hypothetical protein